MRTKNQEPAKISMGYLVKRDTCFSRPQAKRVGGAPAISVFVGDTSSDSFQVAALIVKEFDGYYERVGCDSQCWMVVEKR
jgi:hypothetical protein